MPLGLLLEFWNGRAPGFRPFRNAYVELQSSLSASDCRRRKLKCTFGSVATSPPTIKLTLIASTAATEPEARDALRGIKARRRKGDPMTCCCCPATLGAAPFTLILGHGNDDAIPHAEAGLCRRCGPNLEVAGERAMQIVRGTWPVMVGYQ